MSDTTAIPPEQPAEATVPLQYDKQLEDLKQLSNVLNSPAARALVSRLQGQKTCGFILAHAEELMAGEED
jgi:hypothetical protein